MRDREVPPGMPEICTHKFRKWSCKISKKTNRKTIQTKIFIKIKNIVGTISNIILFIKEYFLSDFFHFDHNLKNDDDVFLI